MAKRDSTTMLLDSLVEDGLADFDLGQMEGYNSGAEEQTAQSMSTTRSTSHGSNSTPRPVAPPVDVSGVSNMQLTGRPAIKLYLSCDPDTFSVYQVTVRQSIELFEALQSDVESNAQGRNHPIVLGQVGIRCRHCNFIPPSQRSRGSTYYPSKLSGLYQAAQNLAVGHLIDSCTYVPDDIRECLTRLRDQKSAAGGGKNEWAKRAIALGVYESDHGLRFADRLDALIPKHHTVH
ncbi:hypothetical protein ACA910_019912 [Epithemia clementina (nom. ined.)]